MDSVFLLGQLVEAPVLEHAVVQKILVDGREFVLELGLQMANDLCVTLHGDSLCVGSAPIVATPHPLRNPSPARGALPLAACACTGRQADRFVTK
jgi:hypothetical protein